MGIVTDISPKLGHSRFSVSLAPHLTQSELRSVLDGVTCGELSCDRAARLLSPEATADDVRSLARWRSS